MKVQGNYASLVRGVSQQAPADRLEGQHGEQLNMLSDPIRGLVRRNGTVIEDQLLASAPGNTGDATVDSFSYRTYSFRSDARELDLMYRSRAKVGPLSPNHLDGIVVYDKTPDNNAGFMPLVTSGTDTAIGSYMDGGFSAVQALGSYVLLAGNIVPPAYSTTDNMVGTTNEHVGVAWVRGGAYARTYTMTVVMTDNTSHTVSYTTKTAAYPGTLDTSGIAFTATDYQKQVNDLTYAYNAAVNQWISSASQDIVPSNIAEQLRLLIQAAGVSVNVRNGSHIGLAGIKSLEVTDGGDGSLFVALLSETAAADEVTDMHFVGKTVKVKPRTADSEAFYLKASAKDDNTGLGGLRPVIWREAAGITQTPTQMFAIGVLHKAKFYVASSPTILAALVLAQTGDTLVVPPLVSSVSGDPTSSKPPAFFGKTITALALFQDRLMVASNSTVNLSRPGDYFNFYRTSMLTLADDDPIEVYALGTEGDTIRRAAVFDRSLLMYGDKYHYLMNGRQVQTPATASIAVQFKVDNTAGAQPVSTGQYVFALKEDTQMAATRLMQTQTGDFQDTPKLVDVSLQLRDYINGTPAELVALASPDMLFVRTEHFLKSTGAFPRARPSGLYVYQYLDGPNGTRTADSWSAWEWSMALGTPIGLSQTAGGDGVMIYTVAWGKDVSGNPTRAVIAMSASARSDPTGLPYLDGMRKAEAAQTSGLFTAGAAVAVQPLVFTAAGSAYSNATPSITDADRFAGLQHPHYTMGDAPAETVDPFRWTGVQGRYSDYVAAYPTGNTGDLWTGLAFPAFVDITNPFMRDFHGKAKTWGRLTLGRLRATLIRTAGFDSKYIDHTGTKQGPHFSGTFERIRYGINVWVGRDTREVQVRLGARDWLPLTINALEWAGQWFDTKSR